MVTYRMIYLFGDSGWFLATAEVCLEASTHCWRTGVGDGVFQLSSFDYDVDFAWSRFTLGLDGSFSASTSSSAARCDGSEDVPDGSSSTLSWSVR